MELLNTKFHIPEPERHSWLIPRKSLVDRLRAHADRQLILVQAPAGYGKTTLLSQWIHGQKRTGRTCWFSIDQMDNRESTFWSYFFGSIEKKHPGLCRSALLRLESERNFPIADIIISALNEIETAGGKISVVLDDYHLIHSAQIHNGLNFLLDHPLENLSLILSSREKPRIDYSRLRLTGRMLEIDKSDLKFTESEALQFFSGTELGDISRARKKQMFVKSEGWAAAIRLLALHPDGYRKAAGHMVSPAGRLVHEYMWQEIFSRLSPDLQAFLTVISFLDRFCPKLCREITDDAQTGTHLQYLIRHQFFIIPLDDEGVWFRFHHLFQDFLRSEFSKLPVQIQQPYHYRASVFFDQAGCFDEAFTHALEAGDEHRAGQILAGHIAAIYGHGSDELVSFHLNRLKESTILSDPILSGYYLGFKIFTGDFDRIEQLEQLIPRMRDEKNRRLATGFHLAFKAYRTFCVHGDLANTIMLSEKAKTILPRHHGAMIRLLDYMQAISYRYSGQIQKAIPLCRPDREDNLLMSTLVATNSADLDIELGRLKTAHANIRHQISVVEGVFRTGTPPSIFGFLYIIMGKILKLENRIEDAQAQFAKGLAILKNTELLELIIISLGEYAHFLMVCKEYKRALEAIDKAIHLTKLNFSWVENLMLAVRQWIRIRMGHLDAVSDWAKRYPVEESVPIPFVQSDEYLVIARYYIAVKNFEPAARIVNCFIEKDLEDQRFGRLIECYVLKAEILCGLGSSDDAADSLLKAFDLSVKDGQVMAYLQDIDKTKDLFKHLHHAGRLPAYLVPHLAFIKGQDTGQKPETVVIHDYMESFSERETDLLKLFREGLSNKEAADRLCLSVNTVRWYASRIFDKLDVKRRGQAVSKAVEFGLI